MMNNALFILSAPSGAGKTELAKKLAAEFSDLGNVISHTTRRPRRGEKEGKDYHFVSQKQFDKMIEQNAFLEYARVFGKSYGTSMEAVKSIWKQGKEAMLVIDWQGTLQVQKKMPDAISIFVLPPSLKTLKERLSARKEESKKMIEKRFAEARQEIEQYKLYDYLIINDDFEKAITELKSIVVAYRCRREVKQELCKTLLDALTLD